MKALHFIGGRAIDPSTGVDEVNDVFVENGVFVGVPCADCGDPVVIDVSGKWVVPGLIDGHVHLREPGQTHKETIETGLAAAAAGGFTAVVSMPNTTPATDNLEIVEQIRRQARELASTRLVPASAITVGRLGAHLVDMGALAAAGVTVFTDDGSGVQDDDVMRAALVESARLGVIIAQHAQFDHLSAGGAMHDGDVSRRLGVPGWPAVAEDEMVARDIRLLREVGGRLHVSHISTRGAVEMVRAAKAEGLSVTAEVTPHHLHLTDALVETAGTAAKVCPPLRPWDDVLACREGLADGTIDVVATDHAPHTEADKDKPLVDAAFGMVGLEVAVPMLLELVQQGVITPLRMIQAMSTDAAKIFGLEGGTLKDGARGDLTIIDPNAPYRIDPLDFLSMGKNTPVAGRQVPGRACCTVVAGRIVFGEGL